MSNSPESATASSETSHEYEDLLDEFVASGDERRSFRTDYVLECFGRKRRGAVVNEQIKIWLDENNLEMFPQIAEADYYGEVLLSRRGDRSTGTDTEDTASNLLVVAEGVPGIQEWVLSSLKDDAEELDLLEYGASVDDALSMMQEKSRTRLPFFFSGEDRSTLIGTVTLAQLAFARRAQDPKLIELATTQVPVVGTNEKLFDWIPTILRHGFIYGKSSSGEIVQIYTVYDVATHLDSIAAMFLRANEIEDLLREVLSRVPDQQIRTAKKTSSLTQIPLNEEQTKYFSQEEIGAGGSGTHPRPVDTLMFGDYMKCIGQPEIWEEHFASVEVPGMTKELCLRSLNDARLARNSVMHFNRSNSPESLIPSFEVLAVWLRKVANTVKTS